MPIVVDARTALIDLRALPSIVRYNFGEYDRVLRSLTTADWSWVTPSAAVPVGVVCACRFALG